VLVRAVKSKGLFLGETKQALPIRHKRVTQQTPIKRFQPFGELWGAAVTSQRSARMKRLPCEASSTAGGIDRTVCRWRGLLTGFPQNDQTIRPKAKDVPVIVKRSRLIAPPRFAFSMQKLRRGASVGPRTDKIFHRLLFVAVAIRTNVSGKLIRPRKRCLVREGIH
jgi:hypothetical protein